ncbi:hypothetical protein [Streptomyces rubiginosohelvolus]|uniref:hypothetical protein n=1 Tax=Streptomyces rubiginosohelvolus TaxID=67362 RepID=UPI003F4CE4DD
MTGAFLGLEMYEGVDPEGAERAFEAREQPAAPAGVLDERGPVARRAVRHRLRRTKKVQGGAARNDLGRRSNPPHPPAVLIDDRTVRRA